MANDKREPRTKREIEEEKQRLQEVTDSLTRQRDASLKLTEEMKKGTAQAVVNYETNLELAKKQKQAGDEAASRDATFAGLTAVIESQAMAALAQVEDNKAARLEADRKEAKKELDDIEKKREANAKLGVVQRFRKGMKDGDKDLGKGIKTPNFITKLAKLGLGLVGVKVFTTMIQNFDKVKTFTKENIVPALEGTFNFLKDTMYPFIKDNFKEIFDGLVKVGAAFIAFSVFTKIYNAILFVKRGLMMINAGLIAVGVDLGKMTVGGVLSKIWGAVKFLGRAFLAVNLAVLKLAGNLIAMTVKGAIFLVSQAIKFLKAGFIAVQLFTMKLATSLFSMVATGGKGAVVMLAGAFSKMRLGLLAISTFITATMVPALMATLATLATVMAPLLPFIAAGAAIAAGLYFLVQYAKDYNGFDDAFDLIGLALAEAKDGFLRLGNAIIKMRNFVTGLVGSIAEYVGFEPDVLGPQVALYEVNNAQKFRSEVHRKQELAAQEGEKKLSQLDDDPLMEGLDMTQFPELANLQGDLNNAMSDAQMMLSQTNVSNVATTNNSSSNHMYGNPDPAVDNNDGLDRLAKLYNAGLVY